MLTPTPTVIPKLATDIKEFSKALKALVNPERGAERATRQIHATEEVFPLQTYGMMLRVRRRWVDFLANATTKENVEKRWNDLQNLDQVLGSYIAAFKYAYLRPYGLGYEKSLVEDRKTTWYTNGIFVVRNDGKDPFKEDIDAKVMVYAVVGLSGWDPLPVPKGKQHLGKDIRAPDIYHDIQKGPYVWLRPVATMEINPTLRDAIKAKYDYFAGKGELPLNVEADPDLNVFKFNFLSFSGDEKPQIIRDALVHKEESTYIEIAWKKSVSNDVYHHVFPYTMKQAPRKTGYNSYVVEESPDKSIWREIRTAANSTFLSGTTAIFGGNEDFLRNQEGGVVIDGIMYMHPLPSLDTFGITSALARPWSTYDTDEERQGRFSIGVYETLPLTVNIHQGDGVKGDPHETMTSDRTKVSYSSVTPLISEKAYPYTVSPYSSVSVDMIFAPYSSLALSNENGTYGKPDHIDKLKSSANFYLQSISDDATIGDNPEKRLSLGNYNNFDFYTERSGNEIMGKEVGVEVTNDRGSAESLGDYEEVNAKIVRRDRKGNPELLDICWSPADVNCTTRIPNTSETGVSVVATPYGNRLGMALLCVMSSPVKTGHFVELTKNMRREGFNPMPGKQPSADNTSSYVYFSYKSDSPGWTKCIESLAFDARRRLPMDNNTVLVSPPGKYANDTLTKDVIAGYGDDTAETYNMEKNMGNILLYISRIPFVDWSTSTSGDIAHQMFHVVAISTDFDPIVDIIPTAGYSLIPKLGNYFSDARGRMAALPVLRGLIAFSDCISIIDSVSQQIRDEREAAEDLALAGIPSSSRSVSLESPTTLPAAQGVIDSIQARAIASISPASITPSIIDSLSGATSAEGIGEILDLTVIYSAGKNDDLYDYLKSELRNEIDKHKIPAALKKLNITIPWEGKDLRFTPKQITERNQRLLKGAKKLRMSMLSGFFEGGEQKKVNAFLYGVWRNQVLRTQEKVRSYLTRYESGRMPSDLQQGTEWAAAFIARANYFKMEYGHFIDMHTIQSLVLETLQSRPRRYNRLLKKHDKDELMSRVTETFGDFLFIPSNVPKRGKKGKESTEDKEFNKRYVYDSGRFNSILNNIISTMVRKVYNSPATSDSDKVSDTLMRNAMQGELMDEERDIHRMALYIQAVCRNVARDVSSQRSVTESLQTWEQVLSSVPGTPGITPTSFTGVQTSSAPSSFYAGTPTSGSTSAQLQDTIGTDLVSYQQEPGDYDPQVRRAEEGAVDASSINSSLEGFSSIESSLSNSIFRNVQITIPSQGSDMFDVLIGEEPVFVVVKPKKKAPPVKKAPPPKKKAPTPVITLTDKEEQIKISLERLRDEKVDIVPTSYMVEKYNETITTIDDYIDDIKATLKIAEDKKLRDRGLESLMNAVRRKRQHYEDVLSKLVKERKDVILPITRWLNNSKQMLTTDLDYNHVVYQIWEGSVLQVTRYNEPYQTVYDQLKAYRQTLLEEVKATAQLSDAARIKNGIDGLVHNANNDVVTAPTFDTNDAMEIYLKKDPGIYVLLYSAYVMEGEVDAFFNAKPEIPKLGIDGKAGRLEKLADAKDALTIAMNFYEGMALGIRVTIPGLARHKKPEAIKVGGAGTEVRLYKKEEGMFMTRDFLRAARNSIRGRPLSGTITFLHKDGSDCTEVTIVAMDEKVSRLRRRAREGLLDYFYPLHNMGGQMGLGPSRYVDSDNSFYHTYIDKKAYIGIPKEGSIQLNVSIGGLTTFSYDLNEIGVPAHISRRVYSKKPFSFFLKRGNVGILITTSEGVDSRKWDDHIKISSVVLTV